jgi:tetratricopeptide (TPR) repeat protein
LGWALYFARRYDEAITQCRIVLDLDTHYLLTYVVLGQVQLAACRYDEAIGALQSAVSVSEGLAFTSAVLGHAYARAGRRREAKKVLENLEQRSRAGYVSPFCGALVYAGLGDRDHAFSSLEQAYEERSNWLAYLKAWPLMDDLRADPRFTVLLGKVGLG